MKINFNNIIEVITFYYAYIYIYILTKENIQETIHNT